ncbi:MAG: hypothetical protein KTR14_00350 [Vampirovibrio sp.]|nr:hypothetical protein [Vampirovibrio sp.]
MASLGVDPIGTLGGTSSDYRPLVRQKVPLVFHMPYTPYTTHTSGPSMDLLESFRSPLPVGDRYDFWWLTASKALMGGLLVGAIGSKLTGIAFSSLFAAKAVISVGESFSLDKLFENKQALARRMLGRVPAGFRGANPYASVHPEELDRLMAPLAGAMTSIASLLVALGGYGLAKQMKKPEITNVMPEKTALRGIKRLMTVIGQWRIWSSLRKTPVRQIATLTVLGLGVNLLTRPLAEYASEEFKRLERH